MRSNTGLMRKLVHQFDDPSWLTSSELKNRRCVLWVVLALLLASYCLDWGIATQQAVRCLLDESKPTGQWVDTFASWNWWSVVTFLVSLCALRFAIGRCLVQNPLSRPVLREAAIVGFAWVVPLLLTRILSLFLPDSRCPPGSTDSEPWLGIYQLSGPVEEIWFAAAVAVWMLLWADRPLVKFLGVVIGGGFLRGIFHVYQGWESVGLFVWGAVAAMAIALTGRWIILFILHYLNNALITAGGFDSIIAAFAGFVVCSVIFACGPEKNANGLSSDRPGGSRLPNDRGPRNL